MKLLILFLCGVTIILAVFAALPLMQHKKMPKLNFSTPIAIGGNKLQVAAARTDLSRQQGLSGQRSLGEGQGMLFDFHNSERKQPGFWMKDMNFPIDIIWISRDEVIGINSNVPIPKRGADLKILPLYFPDEPIDTVVEVPAGWCQRHNVKVGAKLEYYNITAF